MNPATFAFSVLATVLLIGVLVAVGAGLWALRARRQPDPAARMQTPVRKFTGYDQALAVAGRRRWLAQSRTGRPWRRPADRVRPARRNDTRVVRFRKEGSGA